MVTPTQRLLTRLRQLVRWIEFASIANVIVSTGIAYMLNQYQPKIEGAFSSFVSTITAHISLILFSVLSAFVTWFIGSFLYWIRCRYLALYGWLEMMVGITTAVYLLIGFDLVSTSQPAYLGPVFGLLAALYVIVRSYDNIYKSLTSEASLRAWNVIFFGLESVERQR